MTITELKPCPFCGSDCRVEQFPHNVKLWMCANNKMFGGTCPDETAYLYAEAWNTRTAMHSSRPRDEDVERVARALCEEDGYDPDALEPGDDVYQGRDGLPSPCIDGHNRKDDPCHFFWRRYDELARAAIASLEGADAE